MSLLCINKANAKDKMYMSVERLQTKTKEVTCLTYTGLTVDLEPSRLSLIRKATVLSRIFPHFDFIIEENAARRKWKYDDPKVDCAD
jgi:hypothetical protein